jgi:isopentenyl-diphosphate delta-isomerase
MGDIERRKRDHLEIVMSGAARHSAPVGFDAIAFAHNALPESDFAAIDLRTEFLGRAPKLPYLASSMTGGPTAAEKINRAIAEAAGERDFAMAVGSQRIALTAGHGHGLGAKLRRLAPKVPIYGNLGAV